MKSQNQKRTEITGARAAKRAQRERELEVARLAKLVGEVPVDAGALAPSGSYGIPDFVRRGYYVDLPFTCQACGQAQVWSASQQKWWYEVAKGDAKTTATRCRPCRAAERARREEARRVHLEGLALKRQRPGR